MREDSLSPGEFCFALLGLSLMFVYAAGAALAEWYFLEFVKHIHIETMYILTLHTGLVKQRVFNTYNGFPLVIIEVAEYSFLPLG